MRFHKHVSEEVRELLSRQLKEYERTTRMTQEERRELHKWVAFGRSPYDNGDYVYGENGFPLDFISALRLWAEEQEYFNGLSEAERQEYLGRTHSKYYTDEDALVLLVGAYDSLSDPDEELPFQ